MNLITSVMVLLSENSSSNEVIDSVSHALQQMFKKWLHVYISNWSVDFLRLSHANANSLQVSFMEGEIYDALMAKDGNKAPSPDGFPF